MLAVFKASDESPRIFESDWLDMLSRTPFWLVPLFWGPVVLGLFLWGAVHHQVAWAWVVGQFILGAFVWTFTEYVLHRTLFHWKPDTSWGPMLHFLLHGVHHQWVQDKYRLVMPPAVAIILATPFFLGFSALSWMLSPWLPPTWLWGLLSGFLAGYIFYDLSHYHIHHFKARTVWMKRLKAHHMHHHFNDPEHKFGVSNTLWDHVFGSC